MADTYRYAAFISYSHRDQRWAAWLQRALERYRVPSRLVGQEGAHGPVPARLRPVFRDREELAASAELGESIEKALSQSRFLVVVCSPAAARSRWVNAEILQFKRLHGARRILCLVVDGEPGADGEQACFPAALRFRLAQQDGEPGDQPLEPLAADVRASAGGKTLARQKVIAGLLGLELNAIRQRDQQRRQRLMAVVTAASLAAVAFTSWLAGTAMLARKDAELAREDAERRQAQAEDLVDFILSDLHRQLSEVGRLDIMRAASLRARDYFTALDPRDLTETSLQGHAESLRQLGGLALNQLQTEDAYTLFQQAHRMDAELLARAPDDPQRLFNLGQSEFWLGYARLESGDDVQALGHMQTYLDMSRRLYERDATVVDWIMELCYAHNNLSTILARQGDIDAAARHMLEAVRLNREALQLSPGDVRVQEELATSLGWLATVERDAGRLAIALTHRRESRAAWSQLQASDPANAERLDHLAFGWRKEAGLLALLGLDDEARVAFANARQSFEQLVKLDATNVNWSRARLETSAESIAASASGSARTQAARTLADELEAGPLAVATDAAGNPAYASRLAWVTAVAANALETGDSERRSRLMDRAVEDARAAIDVAPQDIPAMALRADVLRLALESGAAGRRAEAAAVADELAAKLVGSSHPIQQQSLAALQLHTREGGPDPDVLQRLGSTGFRSTAFIRACAAARHCADYLQHLKSRQE
jgi:tetratricopeptide (TPR) repeat protein